MESNYKIAYNAEWYKLKKLNPLDLAKRLEIIYCSEKNQLVVPFFEKNYILDFENNTIYRKENGETPKINDSIIILNYLTHSKDYIVNTNKWVTLKEIPNGGALFYPAFYKMAIANLIENFGNDIYKFKESSLKLGGKKINFGDKGYEFKVLPKINICVVLWEGDDEILPNATILFDPSIEHLIHIETIISIGICISEKLISISKI